MSTLDGFGWAGRLARGRSYARNRRVLDVEVTSGLVRARVQGSQTRPYRVEMAVEPFPDQIWDRVVGAMARQALYAAKLLAGELPAEVVQLCDTAEAPLFPGHPDDIVMKCSCPDWAIPCKHVAAVHYAFAAELDRDPALLFRLRGRTREELTAALRTRRGTFGSAGGAKAANKSSSKSGAKARAEAKAAAKLAADSATAAEAVTPEPEPAEAVTVDGFWEHGADLDSLHFEIRPPETPGAVLRLLGRPPGWGGQDDLFDTLHDLYLVASASVRDTALSDVEDDNEAWSEDEQDAQPAGATLSGEGLAAATPAIDPEAAPSVEETGAGGGADGTPEHPDAAR